MTDIYTLTDQIRTQALRLLDRVFHLGPRTSLIGDLWLSKHAALASGLLERHFRVPKGRKQLQMANSPHHHRRNKLCHPRNMQFHALSALRRQTHSQAYETTMVSDRAQYMLCL